MRPVVCSYYTAGTPYEADAAKLEESCRAHGYVSDITPVSAGPSWDAITRMKPRILRDAAARHRGQPLLFLDADCWVQSQDPWLHRKHGRLALHKIDANEIPRGKFGQRHKHQAHRYGGMWQSGRVLLRNDAGLVEILDAWEQELEQRCNDWGDQMALQIACRRLGVEAVTIPRQVLKDALRHASGFHRHWQRAAPDTPQRRMLLLGSAPGIVEWWKEHRAWYVREGFVIAAINNAWQVPDLEDLHLWLHPSDFRGAPAPDMIPRNSTWRYGELGYVTGKTGNWVIGPHWLRGVRLTVTDALVHLLNEALVDGVRLTMHVAGCDMQYPATGQTHFYGTGIADPLRYSEGELARALREVQGFYDQHGATLINASDATETRLPFARIVAEVAA